MKVRMLLPIVLAAVIGSGTVGCAQPGHEAGRSREPGVRSRVEPQSSDSAGGSVASVRAWDFERVDGSQLTVRVRIKWRSGYLLYRVMFSPADAVGDYTSTASVVGLRFYDEDGFEVKLEPHPGPIYLWEAEPPIPPSAQSTPAEYLEAEGRVRMDRASYEAIAELRLARRLEKRKGR